MSALGQDPPQRKDPVVRAAALAYDPLADASPRLVGKGSGEMAARILALAQERGIPIQRDAGLVGFLMRVDLEERIPPELYVAVASVLALVWSADRAASARPSAGAEQPR